MKIQTYRLDLIATRIEHLRAELEAPEELGVLLAARIPAGWPPGHYDRDAMKFFLGRLTEGGAAAMGWYGFYAILRASADQPAVLVANAGYMGPPGPDGSVEIGYSVVPEWRGRGIATECVGALVERAALLPRIQRVSADVHETNAASLAVIERCGFQRVGPGREAGYQRFELQLAA
jgi:[ribosomal protein S5]-alanine N-acetyltransferase